MSIGAFEKFKQHSCTLCAFGIVASFSLTTAVSAEETLYISFNQNADGRSASGSITPIQVQGKLSFAAGKSGSALIAGPYATLKYPTENIVDARAGTIAMWVKPGDWEATEKAFHVFFQTPGTGGLVLYKYFENKNLLMLATRNMSSGPFFSSGAGLDWPAGEWRHIAGTWSAAGVQLFINGEPVTKNPNDAYLPETIGKEFLLGDAAWNSERTSFSLIDEVHIYDEALTASQIKNLYLGKPVTTQPSPPGNVSVNGSTETVSLPPLAPPGGNPTTPAVRTASISPISFSIPTKVQLNGNSVYTAGHAITFADQALPSQMTVSGANFLMAPIALVINQNNRRMIMTPTKPTIGRLANSDVVVATTEYTLGSTSFRVQSIVERDGLIAIELTAVDGAPIPAGDDLLIEMPLDAAAFDYRINWTNNNHDVVETLSTASSIASTSFVPYFWLGNNNGGLFWFSDTSRHWPNASARDAIRLDRIGTTLLFRQKLKAAGQSLPTDWKYRFGLQLTPVKKLPSQWRSLRISPAANANIDLIWPNNSDDSLKYYGYPEAANSEKFAQRIQSIKKNKRQPISYMTPSFISTAAPEWKIHRNEWMTGLFDSTSGDVREMGSSLASVTPTAKSWRDFISTKAATFQKDYGLNGFYFDNVQPYGIYNPQINLGYFADGKTFKEHPIFEYRELLKNIIEKTKADDTSSLILVHMSGHMAVPMFSLADAYIDGEQFRGVVKDNYLDVLSLEKLRAEFMGRQWGLIPIFLPEFDAANAAKIAPTRGLMALLMLHDITVWPLWCNVAEVNRALSALDRFNYQQSEFLPYFDKHPPALSSSQSVLVSSYKNTFTDQLLIIANISKQSASSRICLTNNNVATKAQFINWSTNEQIVNDGQGCINVTVSAQDYLLVRAAAP